MAHKKGLQIKGQTFLLFVLFFKAIQEVKTTMTKIKSSLKELSSIFELQNRFELKVDQ